MIFINRCTYINNNNSNKESERELNLKKENIIVNKWKLLKLFILYVYSEKQHIFHVLAD